MNKQIFSRLIWIFFIIFSQAEIQSQTGAQFEQKPPPFPPIDSQMSSNSNSNSAIQAPPSTPPFVSNLISQQKAKERAAFLQQIQTSVSTEISKQIDEKVKQPSTTQKTATPAESTKSITKKDIKKENNKTDQDKSIEIKISPSIIETISDAFEKPEFKKRISLHIKPSPVHDVIGMIGKLAKIDFIVDPDVIGKTGRIACDKCSVSQILRYICSTNKPRLAVIKYFNSWQVMRFEKAVRLIKIQQQQDFTLKIIDVYNAKFDENLQYRIKEIWGKITSTLGPEEQKRSFITFDTLNRKVFVYSLSNYVYDIENFISEIDRLVPQVRVDIVLITARKSYVYNLGFNWSGVYNRQATLAAINPRIGLAGIGASVNEFPTPSTGFTQTTTPSVPLNNTNLLVDPLNFALNLFSDTAQSLVKIPFIFGGADLNLRRLNLILNAAEAEQKVKILARPSVLTNNGETAELLVGESLPIQTVVTETTEGTTRNINDTRFKDIGTQIKVRPIVNIERKTIMLDVWVQDTEVAGNLSRVINTQGFLQSNTTPPVIQTLYTSNKVLLRSGQTTVIGGLVRNSIQKSKSVMPFFHRIPIIGWFFQATSNEELDEEQLIFITPTLVEPLPY